MKTLITAHAGAEGTQANTLEGLTQLLSVGADVLEVDVHRGPDGLVLSHDAPEEGSRAPLLKDALTMLVSAVDSRMNLDVKQAGLVQEAWELAQQLGVSDRVLFTGYAGEEDLAYIRRNRVTLWFNFTLLPREEWPQAHKTVLARGFEILNIDRRAVHDAMLEEAAGRLAVWTVDEEQELRRLLSAGVRNITTNQPRMALRLRRDILGY